MYKDSNQSIGGIAYTKPILRTAAEVYPWAVVPPRPVHAPPPVTDAQRLAAEDHLNHGVARRAAERAGVRKHLTAPAPAAPPTAPAAAIDLEGMAGIHSMLALLEARLTSLAQRMDAQAQLIEALQGQLDALGFTGDAA